MSPAYLAPGASEVRLRLDPGAGWLGGTTGAGERSSMDTLSGASDDAVADLTHALVREVERVLVAVRDTGAELSMWRLQLLLMLEGATRAHVRLAPLAARQGAGDLMQRLRETLGVVARLADRDLGRVGGGPWSPVEHEAEDLETALAHVRSALLPPAPKVLAGAPPAPAKKKKGNRGSPAIDAVLDRVLAATEERLVDHDTVADVWRKAGGYDRRPDRIMGDVIESLRAQVAAGDRAPAEIGNVPGKGWYRKPADPASPA